MLFVNPCVYWLSKSGQEGHTIQKVQSRHVLVASFPGLALTHYDTTSMQSRSGKGQHRYPRTTRYSAAFTYM